jgi:polyhydroxyalkanoate synthesis regulator protein
MVPAPEPITIKLYDNRRLFEPARGRYVTADELAALAREGRAISVRDARSGIDITDLILSRSPTGH